ncbi:MAG: DUF3667 domain-containing protein [Ginsengibacter sp.]
MDHTCSNCSNTFDGKYCNSCGQSVNVPRFTLNHIFEEAFHAFTHADKSFIGFVKDLILNPGKLSWEYIAERKRKKYFNPFTFFILINAINAFVEGGDLNLKENLFHFNNEYGHIFNVYSKVLSLVIIPVFAFIIWLIHLKKPRLLFSEYTVFAMIIVSLYSVVETFVHVINYLGTSLRHSSVSVEDNILYPILFAIYVAYANYSFHKKMNKNSWPKSILAGIFFFAVQFAVQLFVIWSIRGFNGLGHFGIFGIQIS